MSRAKRNFLLIGPGKEFVMTTFSKNTPDLPSLYRPGGGKLRLSQIITTFGPGAVVDLPTDSVMVAGIDKWPHGPVIHEPRLENALGVVSFRAPATRKTLDDIPCVRFPKNLICSNCGLFSWHKKCPECGSSTYPARLIVICPSGHADEFPWRWWVHRQGSCKGTPKLRIDNLKRTAALADLIVRCDTCEQKRSLSGALGPGALEGFSCSGKRPWLIGASDEDCAQKVRSVLRGASNVYFSSTLSALSIPPWSNPIHALLNDHWQTLRSLPEETCRAVIQALPDFQNFNINDVMQAIREHRTNTTTMHSLRKEEFLAFRNPTGGGSTDFQIQREPVPDQFCASIAQVVLAPRLREVCVLRGFTRIDPPDADNVDQPLAPIELEAQNWLPAVEHRGEGIFIELNQEKVRDWEKRPQVQERTKGLDATYAAWRHQRGIPPTGPILPRMVLLHTLSHLLIRQLSLECGYSSSSLKERIYSGPDMCGLLVYTASADSDGSLGGLVQQGKEARFRATLQAMLESSQWCSSDPLCMEHNPYRTGKLTGASCHACSLLAETSCELSNRFLDRALVRDLARVHDTGYFS
jgi:hypothetical protein